MNTHRTPRSVLFMIILLLIGGAYLLSKAIPETEQVNIGNNSTTSPSVPPNVSTTTATSTVKILPYGQIRVHLDERAVFKDLILIPTKLVEDSRCPKGVYCIQAGTVRVMVTLVSGMGTSSQTIKLGSSVTTEAEKITLVSVDPLKGTQVISPAEYIFTFNVEKVEASRPVSSSGCYVGGCSGQICSDKPDAISTCEYRADYACYKTARCERQASGQCGWTQTEALTMCLANPPALQ